jgi:hypothetical protein
MVFAAEGAARAVAWRPGSSLDACASCLGASYLALPSDGIDAGAVGGGGGAVKRPLLTAPWTASFSSSSTGSFIDALLAAEGARSTADAEVGIGVLFEADADDDAPLAPLPV